MYLDFVKEAATEVEDYAISTREYLHKHPELSRKEFKTAEKIEAELKGFGLQPIRVGETGVFAEIKGEREGKTILLRADIDALPIQEEHDTPYRSVNEGVMHACGHDAHTASLLAAAKILASSRDKLKGRVLLAFQQAEEIGYGARVFIDNGYLRGVDRTFGVHLSSSIDAGSVSLTKGANNASVDWFRITVSGKSAHVSVPNLGVDALYVASQIVVGTQSLITRRTDPTDSVLIGIGKFNSGENYNIVASSAVLEGTIRAMSPDSRSQAKADLERLANSTANIYGATVSFEWKDFTSPLINDDIATEEAQRVGCALLGRDKIITDRKFTLGGDDFAELIIAAPGVYAYVGSRNEKISETCVAHHNCHFDIDKSCLKVATELYVAYALEYLSDFKDL